MEKPEFMKIHAVMRDNSCAEKGVHLDDQVVKVEDLYEFRNQLLKDIKHNCLPLTLFLANDG